MAPWGWVYFVRKFSGRHLRLLVHVIFCRINWKNTNSMGDCVPAYTLIFGVNTKKGKDARILWETVNYGIFVIFFVIYSIFFCGRGEHVLRRMCGRRVPTVRGGDVKTRGCAPIHKTAPPCPTLPYMTFNYYYIFRLDTDPLESWQNVVYSASNRFEKDGNGNVLFSSKG